LEIHRRQAAMLVRTKAPPGSVLRHLIISSLATLKGGSLSLNASYKGGVKEEAMRKLRIFSWVFILLFTVASQNAWASDSCKALFDSLSAWVNSPCEGGDCTNVIFYHLAIINVGAWTAYSGKDSADGKLTYVPNQKMSLSGVHLSDPQAKTVFSCRKTTSPGSSLYSFQPFDLSNAEMWSFDLWGPTAMGHGSISLHFTTWNENWNIGLSCQSGYMFGSNGKLGVMLYPDMEKETKFIPPK
jgi:hypothetical protein